MPRAGYLKTTNTLLVFERQTCIGESLDDFRRPLRYCSASCFLPHRRNGLGAVSAGLSGLTITLAAGAASLHGQIQLSEGEKLIPRTFVYLVPAEREQKEDVLRYFAYQVSSGGTFSLSNLPPGSYWILAKVAPENESSILSTLRLPDDVETRTKLRKQAEAVKTEVILKPCETVTGYQLKLASVQKALSTLP